MNQQEIQQLIQQRTFVDNNGKILRMLNLLGAKERTLKNIRYLMQDAPREDLRNSLLYLQDAGYIRIEHKDPAGCVEDNGSDGPHVPVTLTGEGMKLLMGVEDNPAVDV